MNAKSQKDLGASRKQRIPVILDTDIGGDIDDTWALAMLLRSPELDVKLVTTAQGDTVYRAKIVAKLLEVAGRSDVPVGIGISRPKTGSQPPQAEWVAGYDLKQYPGKVHDDGVGALVDTIMGSPTQVTLVCIGPLPNVAAALEREPRIAGKARFVGMHGSLRWSPDKDHRPVAEYNVKADVPACQKVFAAPWDKTITPLDTCGRVKLAGPKYGAVAQSSDPVARAVIENYEIWKRHGGWVKEEGISSILFDCVAVYLAFSEDLLRMERLGVRVTDEGFTVEEPGSPEVRCAVEWKDLGRFEDLIVERLTREGKA